MKQLRLSLTAAGLTLAAATAYAQPADPKFAYASDDDRAALEKNDAVKWEASAQAGLILSTGNSRTTSFSSGITASRKEKKNKLSLEADAAYARSSIFLANDADGNGTISQDEVNRPSVTTTKSWLLKGRYDRFLTANNSLFIAGGASADRPAGKELVGNGQLGYSRQLYHEGPHTFVGELGYDYTYEDLVAAGDGISIHSVRGFLGYKGALSDDTVFEGHVEALFNLNKLDTPTREASAFEDDRFNGKVALTTKLSTKLSFRFSFEARFDNVPAPRPPFSLPYADGFVPVADKLDTRAEAALIVALL